MQTNKIYFLKLPIKLEYSRLLWI